MKFKLVEDLEQDLQAQAAKQNRIRNEIKNLFKNTDFKEKKNINGISFNATKNNIEASFYIDDAASYNGYVYDGVEYNLQVEGDLTTAIDSAETVLREYDSIEAVQEDEIDEVE